MKNPMRKKGLEGRLSDKTEGGYGKMEKMEKVEKVEKGRTALDYG